MILIRRLDEKADNLVFMYYLIYTSEAKLGVDEVELYEILKSSVRNNLKLDITGLLIFHSGTFIQMLEGSRESVHEIYQVIKEDVRHSNVQKLISSTADRRYFSDWRMALEVVHEKTFTEIEAYQSLIDSSSFLAGLNRNHVGIRLLKYFYETYKTKPYTPLV